MKITFFSKKKKKTNFFFFKLPRPLWFDITTSFMSSFSKINKIIYEYIFFLKSFSSHIIYSVILYRDFDDVFSYRIFDGILTKKLLHTCRTTGLPTFKWPLINRIFLLGIIG